MCGVLGLMGSDMVPQIADALFFLQHRGQEGSGVLTWDPGEAKFQLLRAKGLVHSLIKKINDKDLTLTGQAAIAHVRYSTVARKEQAGSSLGQLQPFFTHALSGFGLAYNGNITNHLALREVLRKKWKKVFLSDNDAETLLYWLSCHLEEAVQKNSALLGEPKQALELMGHILHPAVQGAYSGVAIVGELGLLAFRDPLGIRPLLMGRGQSQHGEWVTAFASESYVLQWLGLTEIRPLAPGEMVLVSCDHQILTYSKSSSMGQFPCSFEWAYFASAEGRLEGRSVYQVRQRLGQLLAESVRSKLGAGLSHLDLVASVPETSRIAALALSESLSVPYREVILKNRYIQRSFILPSQKMREAALEMKLLPVQEEIAGRTILLVDDSIVRGTTAKKIVRMLKKAGAKAVYLASATPPVRYPCYLGVDFPLADELLLNQVRESDLAKTLGVEGVFYLEQHRLKEAIGRGDQICHACFDGRYPLPLQELEIQRFEQQRRESC